MAKILKNRKDLRMGWKEKLEAELKSIGEIIPLVNEELAAIKTASSLFEKNREEVQHTLNKKKINGWEIEKFAEEDVAVYHGLLKLQLGSGNPEKLLSSIKDAFEEAAKIKANFMEKREDAIEEGKEMLRTEADLLPDNRKEYLPPMLHLNSPLPKFSKKHLDYPYKFHLKHLRNSSLSNSTSHLLKPIVSVLNSQSLGAGRNNAVKISKDVGHKLKLKTVLKLDSPQGVIRQVERRIKKQSANPFHGKGNA